jgi:hypothetical protein
MWMDMDKDEMAGALIQMACGKEGCGWIWTGVDGYGRVWMDMDGC